MNIIQRIAKNTLALFFAQFCTSILSIILTISIARLLGDVVFGKYSFVIAFTAIFSVFTDLGYNTLLIRDVARDKSLGNKYLNNVLIIRSLLSIIIFIIIAITINLLDYPYDIKNIIYLFGIATLFVSFTDVFFVTFRAFERMEFEAIIKIFTNLLKTSLGLLILFLGFGLIELALIFLFSSLIGFFLSSLICEKKIVKTKLDLDFGFFRNTIKVALPLSFLTIFSLIYVKIDTVMLSILKGYAVVGWYNAAYSLIISLKVFPQIFMNALFPLMAIFFVSSKNSSKIVFIKSFNYLFILGLPITVGITILANKIILILYGHQFESSIIALQILAWDVLIAFLYWSLSITLISIDKQKQMIIVAGLTVILNISLNLVLISPFSYVGAGIATLISEGFLITLYLYIAHKHSYKIQFQKIFPKPILACSIMGIFIYFFITINILLLIILSTIIYFILLYYLKGFQKEDISFFKKLLTR